MEGTQVNFAVNQVVPQLDIIQLAQRTLPHH